MGTGSARKRGLQLITSRFNNHPEDFKNRRQPITFSQPAILVGLEAEISRAGEEFENAVIEEPHQNDALWYPGAPNEITVEYFYEGAPVEVTDPDFKKLIAEEKRETRIDQGEETSRFYTKGKWDRQMKLGPSYLSQDVISPEDIRVFDDVLVKDFDKMLAHIAERLPQSAGRG